MRWYLIKESSVSRPRVKNAAGRTWVSKSDVPVWAVFVAGSTSILSSLALRLRERSSLSLVTETGLLPLSLDGGVGWEIGKV